MSQAGGMRRQVACRRQNEAEAYCTRRAVRVQRDAVGFVGSGHLSPWAPEDFHDVVCNYSAETAEMSGCKRRTEDVGGTRTLVLNGTVLRRSMTPLCEGVLKDRSPKLPRHGWRVRV